MRTLPKYVFRDVDARGNVRLYFWRRPGSKIRIHSEPGTPEFERDYQAALYGRTTPKKEPEPPPIDLARPQASTLRWLCVKYFEGHDFKELDASTRRVRRQIIEHCLRERIAPEASETFADFPLDRLTSKAIRVLRDRKREFPEAANSRVKAFRQVFAWGLEAEVHDALTTNHARDVAYLSGRPEGFHAWTIDDIEAFEQAHPIGTTARLAFALLLYTGQRRSDVVRFGRQHVRDEWIRFTQHKGRRRKPVRLEIPIIPELRRIIDASPAGDLTFVVTEFGRPFSAAGFGNRMRKWCDAAGLPECSAHGLRKAAAARLAVLGCSDREIMAITGHTTVKEIDRYTRGVRRRALAENVLRRHGAV